MFIFQSFETKFSRVKTAQNNVILLLFFSEAVFRKETVDVRKSFQRYSYPEVISNGGSIQILFHKTMGTNCTCFVLVFQRGGNEQILQSRSDIF